MGMENEDIRINLKSEATRLVDLRDDFRSVEGLNDTQVIEASQDHVGAELHPAEVASEFVQREIDLSMLSKIEGEIDDVQRALAKLDDGTYGTCEACHARIAEARLQALPAARFCVTCEARVEEPNPNRPNRDVLRHIS